MIDASPLQLVRLIKAVARLALPASEQIQYLSGLGVLPSVDELALELEDEIGPLPQFVQNGWISDAEATAITSLDQRIQQMSGIKNAGLWTEVGLIESSEWCDVRALARAALAR